MVVMVVEVQQVVRTCLDYIDRCGHGGPQEATSVANGGNNKSPCSHGKTPALKGALLIFGVEETIVTYNVMHIVRSRPDPRTMNRMA